MHKFLIVGLLVFSSVPFARAQDGDWGSFMSFRTEMDRLSRESRLQNPLLLLDFSCSGEEGGCDPILRMFVRTASTDKYRLPMLPPRLSLENGEIKADKKRYKTEKKQGEALLAEACETLPQTEICDGPWGLKKIFKLSELEGEGAFALKLQTHLQKPGATSSQVGADSPEQTLRMEIPLAAVSQRVVVFLWEENGVLNLPQTFVPGAS